MEKQKVISIQATKMKRLLIRIKGETSLISNRFEWKEYLGQLTGKGKTKKDEKNLEKEFKRSLHPKQNGHYTHPSMSIIHCAATATVYAGKRFSKNKVYGDLRIIDGVEFLEIISKKDPEMRVDPAVQGGAPAVISRAEFMEWEMEVPLEFSFYSQEEIINLINDGGRFVGIGAWRPGSKKGGVHGRFVVIDAKVI